VWTGGTIYASDSQSKGGCMLTRSTMKPATPHARQDTRAGQLPPYACYWIERMKRRLSGWIGRALFGNSLAKAAICAADAVTGSLRTTQLTISEHGGVVSDPS